MIRRSKVVLFVPFVNKDYENNWGNQIQFDSSDGSMYQYYCEKQNFYRRENIIPDPKKWWANGNIICNEHCRYRNKANETQYWGDQFLTQLRDMLEDACQHRNIPDCEFFINKRDYPHLKENLSEPYGFLFDRDDQNPNEDLPLTRHRYNSYAPIMSFYISKRFADIPFPCSEDWEAATGLVFPQTFKHSHCDACPCGNAIHCEKNWECFCEKSHHGIESARDLFTTSNFIKFYKPWEEKINTAFFRGSATGGGTEVDTNQRLHLAQLSNQWKQDIRYNGQNHDVPFLNAEITTWNLRDKKIAGKPMTFIRTNNEKFVFEAGKKHFIPIYEQSKYKYLLYVEGHCAANRYAFLMRLGSVILKVSSRCVANEMWYFPLLKPYEDHIPIQEDLSNLAEQIQWCRDNDDKCRQIAIRAKELYEKYISKKAIHDYLEIICHRVAQRFEPAPQWYKRPSYVDKPIKKPSFSPSNGKCVSNRTYCKRCLELKKEKEEQEQDEENRRKQLKGSFDNRRSSYYDRFDSYRDNTQKRQPPGEKIPQCRKCRRAKNACICH